MNLWEDRDWDATEGRWVDEGKCRICGGISAEDICSATCHDLWSLRYERENDCYA